MNEIIGWISGVLAAGVGLLWVNVTAICVGGACYPLAGWLLGVIAAAFGGIAYKIKTLFRKKK